MPEAAPEAFPQPIPEAAPEALPQPIPVAVPEAMPEAIPEPAAIPEPIAAPEAAPYPNPNAVAEPGWAHPTHPPHPPHPTHPGHPWIKESDNAPYYSTLARSQPEPSPSSPHPPPQHKGFAGGVESCDTTNITRKTNDSDYLHSLMRELKAPRFYPGSNIDLLYSLFGGFQVSLASFCESQQLAMLYFTWESPLVVVNIPSFLTTGVGWNEMT